MTLDDEKPNRFFFFFFEEEKANRSSKAITPHPGLSLVRFELFGLKKKQNTNRVKTSFFFGDTKNGFN